jgi:hypothetical protein
MKKVENFNQILDKKLMERVYNHYSNQIFTVIKDNNNNNSQKSIS